MINVVSGRDLVDKTPIPARQLIENMPSNNKQFNIKGNSMILTSGVHEMGISYVAYHAKIENKLEYIAFMLKQLAMS